MNNHLKEAIEKFVVSEPIADLGIVQCTLLQHRLEQFCDYMELQRLNVEKKIVGRCVHDHKPITCTGECDTNCPHPFWDNTRKAINCAFIIEGERLKVRKVNLEQQEADYGESIHSNR